MELKRVHNPASLALDDTIGHCQHTDTVRAELRPIRGKNSELAVVIVERGHGRRATYKTNIKAFCVEALNAYHEPGEAQTGDGKTEEENSA